MENGHKYRLQKINEIQATLEDECDARMLLSKKYHKASKIINNIDWVLIALSMMTSMASVGLMSSVLGIPIAIGMQVVAIGTGVMNIVGRVVNKKFVAKANKHERIKDLAETQLNTIMAHVSQAWNDGKIDDEEFQLIVTEFMKYNELKEEIRTKTKKFIDEQNAQKNDMLRNER